MPSALEFLGRGEGPGAASDRARDIRDHAAVFATDVPQRRGWGGVGGAHRTRDIGPVFLPLVPETVSRGRHRKGGRIGQPHCRIGRVSGDDRSTDGNGRAVRADNFVSHSGRRTEGELVFILGEQHRLPGVRPGHNDAGFVKRTLHNAGVTAFAEDLHRIHDLTCGPISRPN